MVSSIRQFAGYQLIEILDQISSWTLYRGQRATDTQTILIKVLNDTYPALTDLLQLYHAHSMTNSQTAFLALGVLRSIEIRSESNYFGLLIEDAGGILLHHFLEQHSKLDIQRFLKIAIQLAAIIEGIHLQQIIHKNIRPQTIMIQPETLQVWLTGFELASQKIQSERLVNPLVETLCYVSPEQTGRMNRGVDYRTDFYSLGATFYELLTAHPLCTSQDPMELIYYHLTQVPAPPKKLNAQIPQVLSDIILKLIAKAPEDRYQSALGLRTDLEQCLHYWTQSQTIPAFPLQQLDRSDQFIIPEIVVGRGAEIELLLSSFEHASQGSCTLMLITGYAGIGKSALVQEIHRPVVRQQGYFISGKFDQFKRDIPFFAFKQAFHQLIRQLQTHSQADLSHWKAQILSCIAGHGQVLLDLIPDLEMIIGPQPELSPVDPASAEQRFHQVLSEFITVFATASHPLVLFLDDLQWADPGSLRLLKSLLGTTQYLLIIGAYRDHEIETSHPLRVALSEIKQQTDANVIELELGPLDRLALNQLIATSLSCPEPIALPLTDLIFNKTQGNPFFSTQLLSTFFKQNLLFFNQEQGYWECDIAKAKTLDLSDDIVEFMVFRLQQLSTETQSILKLAACIGNCFNLSLLALVSRHDPFEVGRLLEPALKQGLILPSNEIYKFFQDVSLPSMTESYQDLAAEVEFRFLHDRVQQAAYSLIPTKDQPAMHLAIGRLFLQATSTPDRIDSLFEVVNQLNKGIPLIQDQHEKDQLIQLNLTAGLKAKAATAYAASSHYLFTAITLLPETCWERSYNLTLQLYQAAAESHYLNAQFEMSDQLIHVALAQVTSVLDQAKLYNLLVVQWSNLSDYERAVHIGLQALRLLGIEVEVDTIATELQTCVSNIEHFLRTHPPESLIQAAEMQDPVQICLLQLLMNMAASAYFVNLDLYCFLNARGVLNAIHHGVSSLAAKVISSYGVIFGDRFRDYEMGYRLGQVAMRLCERFQDLAQTCRVYQTMNRIIPWVRPIRETEAIIREGYRAGLESGELLYVGHTLMYKFLHPLIQGDPLRAILEETDDYLQFSQKIQNYSAIDTILGHRLILHYLLGDTSDAVTFADPILNLTEAEYVAGCQSRKTTGSLCLYWILRSQALFMMQHYELAYESIQAAADLLDSISGFIAVALFNVMQSLILLARYPTVSQQEQHNYWSQVDLNQAELQQWYLQCPDNFEAWYRLVEAERLWLSQSILDAMDQYDWAIASARSQSFVQIEALACELVAQKWLQRHKGQLAQPYLRQAWSSYAQWGSTRKTEDLVQRYPVLIGKPTEGASVIQQDLTPTHLSSELDLAAVFKAAQAISSEIQLDHLLSQLLQVVLENAGADRGVLLLANRDRIGVAAIQTAVESKVSLELIPIETTDAVPKTIIHYVTHTRETVVIDQVLKDLRFAADPYLTQQAAQSILCAPLLNQSHLVGLLYLENHVTPHAFTHDRIQVLQLLCAQAVISIENALLYDQLKDYSQSLETKVKERTLALEEALARADSSNRAKSEFLAVISHEIRTPLNGVLGFASLLVSTPLTDEQLDLVESLKVSAKSLLTLINTILDYTKLESGTVQLEYTAVSLHNIVNDVILIQQPIAKTKGLNLKAQISESIPKLVETDGNRLRQILLNLVSNAVKFTDRGDVLIHLIHDHPLYRFEVKDTGIGISPDQLNKLFRPFSQVDSSSTRRFGGTGLGLMISKRLVNLMGGDIGVQSQIDQGSCFYFTFPLETLDDAPDSEVDDDPLTLAHHEQLARSYPMTILVVEDNRINQKVALLILKKLGYDPQLAHNGQEAISMLKITDYDVILMDIQMPQMDGYQATTLIRAWEAEPDFQRDPHYIIAVTAGAVEEDQTRCLEAGMNDYVSKPMKTEHLAPTLIKAWYWLQIKS